MAQRGVVLCIIAVLMHLALSSFSVGINATRLGKASSGLVVGQEFMSSQAAGHGWASIDGEQKHLEEEEVSKRIAPTGPNKPPSVYLRAESFSSMMPPPPPPKMLID